jgi:AcrR family transcriptional regulator
MAQRGRRSPRLSGDDRYQALLHAAEILLDTRPMEDISIEELANGAGISRSNFYFYFASKDEVLLALLDRVIAEVEDRVSALPRDFTREPAATWRRSIGVFVDVFSAHRAVSVAAIAARHRSAEVLALWSSSMQTWVDYSRIVILAEQARGVAPAGIAAHDLAITLTLMNERVLMASLSGEGLAIDEASLVDVLSESWSRAIYGTTSGLLTSRSAATNAGPSVP